MWYLSASDPQSRVGLWVHHEVVAPLDGSAPYRHGWVVVFRHGEPPVLERFGPEPVGSARWLDQHARRPAERAAVPDPLAAELLGSPSRGGAERGGAGADDPRTGADLPGTGSERGGAGADDPRAGADGGGTVAVSPSIGADLAGSPRRDLAGHVSSAGTWFDPPELRGVAGRVRWDLQIEMASVVSEPSAGSVAPLFTFPEWAWRRELLPGAQVLPVPSAPVHGSVEVDGARIELSAHCRGGLAHIYGHGSAERWGWLHADLGDGDVLEIVSATGRRPGLERLPPFAFVQLRHGGRDWPADPAAAAVLFRTDLALPRWHVRGTVGRYRLQVDVTIPPEQAVAVRYTDPDRSTATCTNSELADVDIVLEHRRSRWETAAAWHLHGTAHAEVGTRP